MRTRSAFACLPDRSSASKWCGRCGSRLGSQLSSIPLTMPDSRPSAAIPLVSPCRPAPRRLGGDLARIGRTDGRYVVGIEQTGLEERHAVVELDAVDVERAFGNAENLHALPVEQTLVGDVVDGQDRRHARALPAQIGRRETAWPVIRRATHPAASSCRRGRRRSPRRRATDARSAGRCPASRGPPGRHKDFRCVDKATAREPDTSVRPSAVRASPMQQGSMPARPGRCATTMMSLALAITSG